ncbi:MAG: guanylate kinase [Ekhidna sp.]|nr:guanylate kinase [Ekhidna sp.]MBC6408956.1 guanylate kinase [Ekhidna sp.]MBC6427355.1 guanylate kinase [Ekhidna sp.]
MKGKAVILSAPSGSGKTTIVHELLKRVPELTFSISATTRQMRVSETDGTDYYFLSKKDFQEKIKSNQLLEWEEVYENIYYGTFKEEVQRIWDEGSHVIFDVDVQGGINLKKAFQRKALSIFIKIANVQILRERLKARNTESEDLLEIRVNKAILEMKEEEKFDEVILNDDLQTAIEEAEILVKKFIEK